MRGLSTEQVRNIARTRGLSREQVPQPSVRYRDYRLGVFEGPQPRQLSYVGGLITDSVRYLNVEGDGLGSPATVVDGIGRLSVLPDSSVGVWQECNFNYHNSAGAENGDMGGFNLGGSANITVTSSSDFAKFGLRSFKGVVTANGAVNYAQEATMSGTDAAGKVWTSSVWAYVPLGSSLIGKSYTWKVQEIEGGVWNNNQGSTSGSFVQGWQRLVLTYTTIAANIDNINCQIDWTGTAAEILYTDGWQLEPNGIATPYVESWPNNRLSRAAGYILGDASVLSVTQGWIACRLRVGFASTANPYAGTAINLWNWAASTSNRFQLTFSTASDSFTATINPNGATSQAAVAATFSSASLHTLIVKWDGSNISLSYNGAPFVNTGYTGAPTGLPAQWMLGGRQDVLGQYADGDFLWMLAGTGTLTDADAAVIHANGDTDPTTAPGVPTFGATFNTPTWFVPGLAQVLAATGPITATITNQVGKLISATAVASTASLIRQTTKTLTATTVTATASIVKAIIRALSVTANATVTAAIARAVTFGLAVTATVTSTATIARTVGKLVTASTVAATASMVRSAGKAVSATVTSTATLSRIIQFARSLTATSTVSATAQAIKTAVAALTATATVTASMVRSVGKTAVATVTSTASITRSVAKTVSATVAATASIIRQAAKTITATATSSAAIATVTAFLKSLTANATVTATLQTVRTVLRALTATATSTATMVRSAGKRVTATGTATATIARSVATTLQATAAVTATLTAARAVLLTLAATASAAAALTRSVATTLTANAAATAMVVKQALKTLSANATVTATQAAIKVIRVALTATVTAAASISRSVGKAVSTTSTLTASLVKSVTHSLTATATVAATITKTMAETLIATATTTASVTRSITKRISAAVTVTATATRSIAKAISANATVAATLAKTKTAVQALLAIVTSTATLRRSVAKLVAASVASTASIVKQTTKRVTATVTVTATTFAQFISGGAHVFVQALTASATVSAAMTRSILKELAAIVQASAVFTFPKTAVVTLAANVTAIATMLRHKFWRRGRGGGIQAPNDGFLAEDLAGLIPYPLATEIHDPDSGEIVPPKTGSLV